MSWSDRLKTIWRLRSPNQTQYLTVLQNSNSQKFLFSTILEIVHHIKDLWRRETPSFYVTSTESLVSSRCKCLRGGWTLYKQSTSHLTILNSEKVHHGNRGRVLFLLNFLQHPDAKIELMFLDLSGSDENWQKC